MITDNHTNTVYFSSLLPKKCPVLCTHIEEVLRNHGVTYAYLSGTKDIWCRDYMPVQIESNRLVFFKYTPDYLQDQRGRHLQTNPEEVFYVEANHLQSSLDNSIAIDLIIDGGNVVKCGDTIVMTEKAFVENKKSLEAKWSTCFARLFNVTSRSCLGTARSVSDTVTVLFTLPETTKSY